MKVNFAQNFMSFGKTLVATGGYIREGKSEPCSFYQVKGDEDSKYLKKLYCTDEWCNSEYLEPFIMNLDNEEWEGDEFFAVEDKDGNCIGLTELYDLSHYDKNGRGVYLLETIPMHSSKNEDRNIKYIGETILAFITKLTQKDKGDIVDIPMACDCAVPFYVDKCFFSKGTKEEVEFTNVSLKEKHFDDLIKQNEAHTQTEIKFV